MSDITLRTLLEKIKQRGGKLPDGEEIDSYLSHLILNKMPSSETLQEAFDIGNVEMEMLYADGFAAYEKDDYEESALHFQWLAILNPFIFKYWMGLGGSYLMLKNYEKALLYFAMAALLDGENPYPHYHAAVCYEALHHLQDRKKAIDLALARAASLPKYSSLVKKLESMKVR